MNNFTTIAIFNYPSELLVIKSKLESEGIEYRVKDEHTVQVHHFLSNAIGGIKLQVQEKDFDKTKTLLENAGIPIYYSPNYPIIEKLFKITSKIPLINKLNGEMQILVLVLSVITLIVTGLYFIFR